MNTLHPQGMVERLGERHRKQVMLGRYGRRKEGAPKDVRTLKIAENNDRRGARRRDDDPLRGRLLDLNA